MVVRLLLSASILAFFNTYRVECFDITAGPPLLTGPVFSLATSRPLNDAADADSATNMNIVSYASPMSIRPERLWAIGLYKETYSYENFKKSRKGILQLLTPEHIPIIRLLGGTSGRDLNKEEESRKLGFEWMHYADGQPRVLPGCKSYLCLELQDDLIDGGSHDIAICRVTSMFTDSDAAHLDTQTLRDLGIITEQGRIADS